MSNPNWKGGTSRYLPGEAENQVLNECKENESLAEQKILWEGRIKIRSTVE